MKPPIFISTIMSVAFAIIEPAAATPNCSPPIVRPNVLPKPPIDRLVPKPKDGAGQQQSERKRHSLTI